jgi:hypothetical protein
MFIFADHGFMMQPSFQAGDNMSYPKGDAVLTERRCEAGNLNQNDNCYLFDPAKLNIKTDVYRFAFAKQFGVFEKGKIYFHEGLSLQEDIVPILSIKLKNEQSKESVNVSLSYKGKTEGVVRVYRPQIEINIIGIESLFTPEMSLRLAVTDDNGQIAGYAVDSTFYNSTSDTISIPSGCEKIKVPIQLRDDYQGNVTITALDPDTNITMATLKLETELDF